MDRMCILISSCNAYSDLWDNHFKLLFKYFKGDLFRIVLLTDKPTNKKYENVEIKVVENNNLPSRLHDALLTIKEKYVLVTLDDYYLINDSKRDDFETLLDLCDENKIDYLSIYNRRYTKKKHYKPITTIGDIDLTADYALNLYPAIWNREFLLKCTDFEGSPWEFEPKLKDSAAKYNAVCKYNLSGVYDILDVIRKGKLLKKARKYLKKHGYELPNRKNATFKMEFKQSVADFIYWHMPKWFYRFVRKIAMKFGMKSYSAEASKNGK